LRERESPQGEKASGIRQAAAGAKRRRESEFQSVQRRISHRKGQRNG